MIYIFWSKSNQTDQICSCADFVINLDLYIRLKFLELFDLILNIVNIGTLSVGTTNVETTGIGFS